MRAALAKRLFAGALLGGAVALVHCSGEEPTQIVVTVRASDGECAAIHSTYVRVKTTDDLGVPARASKDGCTTSTKVIGTFVLVPDTSVDATTKFLVATGIHGKQGDLCRFNDPDCIFAKRITRFVPHETVRIDVLMSGACLGKTCAGESETCENGVCTSAVVEPKPEDCAAQGTCLDAGPDVTTAPVDSGIDTGIVDAQPEASVNPCTLSNCEASGGKCEASGVCAFACPSSALCDKTCPPGLSCTFACTGNKSCQKVTCTPMNPSCVIACTGQGACEMPDCAATSCTLTCTGGNPAQRSCANSTMRTGGTINCATTNDCGSLDCNGAVKPCTCPQTNPGVCNGNCAADCKD